MLFDWLVAGHVIDVNPAHAACGPKHVAKRGRTPVLDRDEARALLAVIDTDSFTGLRDRALIGVMILHLRAYWRGAEHECGGLCAVLVA